MTTMHFFEATSTARNWGKFSVRRMDDEQAWRTHDGTRYIASQFGPEHLQVFDLETGKGAVFRPGGRAIYDVKKAGIHVCVLFPLFLEWLYKQDLSDLAALPKLIEFDGVPYRSQGYNLPGTGVWDLEELDAEREAAALRQAALVGVTKGLRLGD